MGEGCGADSSCECVLFVFQLKVLFVVALLVALLPLLLMRFVNIQIEGIRTDMNKLGL